jgi:hypothetical protein
METTSKNLNKNISKTANEKLKYTRHFMASG